jgi:hypothetical protein
MFKKISLLILATIILLFITLYILQKDAQKNHLQSALFEKCLSTLSNGITLSWGAQKESIKYCLNESASVINK